MKKRRERGQAVEAKNVGVEILEPIRRRLKLYVAAHDKKIKAVVNEAIDDYLKRRGA